MKQALLVRPAQLDALLILLLSFLFFLFFIILQISSFLIVSSVFWLLRSLFFCGHPALQDYCLILPILPYFAQFCQFCPFCIILTILPNYENFANHVIFCRFIVILPNFAVWLFCHFCLILPFCLHLFCFFSVQHIQCFLGFGRTQD